MKNKNEYKDTIYDIGCEPFFLHYYSPEQSHVYRSYCQSTLNPKLIIDATGSIIKSLT